MDEIRIPNEATYAPVALTDLITAAPLASALLLGGTLPGRVLSAAALGFYAGSAVKDWTARRDVRWIDFEVEFGADVHFLVPQPDGARREEIGALARRIETGWCDGRRPREEMARQINARLTATIAGITGQRVLTSCEIRSFGLAQVIMPFAMGACDVLSGDVALYRENGIFEPHVIAHEFVHRKGYWKELHAQVIAYLALVTSDDAWFVQSALAERLHRQLKVVSGHDRDVYDTLVEGLEVRRELKDELLALSPERIAFESTATEIMRTLYDQRLKVTGQNGISDYDEGFTNFLWTWTRSPSARQDAGAVAV
jgi:hypothetical protein